MLAIAVGGLLGGCTQVDCSDGFLWLADLPESLTYDEIRDLAVIACRNGACVEGSFDTLPESALPQSGVALVDPARPEAGAEVDLTLLHEPDGSFRVQLWWAVVDPVDGDRYSVRLTDPTGEAVSGVAEASFEYADHWPNGYLITPSCRQVHQEGSTLGAP